MEVGAKGQEEELVKVVVRMGRELKILLKFGDIKSMDERKLSKKDKYIK